MIRVLGMGNVLMGDDAAGPMVLHRLRCRYEVPEGVEALDIGTPGLDLIPYVCGCRALLLVDTVLSSGEPGDLRLYRREDLTRNPPGPRLSPHDPALPQALARADLTGEGPEDFLLVGIVPSRCEQGIGLTPAVEAALPAAEAAVLAELARLGAPLAARPEPDLAPPWWLA